MKPSGYIYTYYAGSDYDNQNIRKEVIGLDYFENSNESEKEDAELTPLYVIPEGYQLVKSAPSGYSEEREVRRIFVKLCSSDVSGDNLGLEFYKEMVKSFCISEANEGDK